MQLSTSCLCSSFKQQINVSWVYSMYNLCKSILCTGINITRHTLQQQACGVTCEVKHYLQNTTLKSFREIPKGKLEYKQEYQKESCSTSVERERWASKPCVLSRCLVKCLWSFVPGDHNNAHISVVVKFISTNESSEQIIYECSIFK